MRHRSRGNAATGIIALALVPCVLTAESPPSTSRREVALPPPQTSGGMALNEALAQRRSCKSLQGKPLSREQLSQLCWAAQGITDKTKGLRTAPSAKALYAVQVLIVDDQGVYRYLPMSNALERLAQEDGLSRLRTAVGQESVNSAMVSMVVAIEPARLEHECGKNAERYSLLEAGHVTQNVLLQVTAIGLASVPIGGIDPIKVSQAIGLSPGLLPVYVLPVGTAGGK